MFSTRILSQRILHGRQQGSSIILRERTRVRKRKQSDGGVAGVILGSLSASIGFILYESSCKRRHEELMENMREEREKLLHQIRE